ncbi:MAG: MATE family efflux transporter [Thermotogota bacterium]
MKKVDNSKNLATKPIFPLLVSLSIPGIIGMLVQALYNVIDSIYIGQFSKEALSALSLAFPYQMILISIAVGTGVGTTSLISRSLGEGKEIKANKTAENALLLTAIYGVLVAIVGFTLSGKLIRIFVENPTLIQMGADYISIIFIGSISMFLPIIGNSILRGEGNTFYPMLALILGAVINIILDPFLIYGLWIFPEMGIKGAAYATVIARLISGSFVLLMLFGADNKIKFNLKYFKPEFSIIKGIYIVGLPAMFMQMLASVMIAGANKIVGQFNPNAIAVVGIFFRLQSFIFMPVFGLNQGYVPIVGYNYGHKNPERVKKAIKIGLLSGLSITTFGFLLFQFFPEQLIMMFNDNKELREIGARALKIISITFPIVGLQIVGVGTFQAIGRGLPSLIISFLRQIIVLLPTMYLLGEIFGLNAVWFAFPISEIFSFTLLAIWLSKVLKKELYKLSSQ